MAIFSMHYKVISRSKGRSACKHVAYILGENVKDDNLDRSYNYTHKTDILHKNTILPYGSLNFAELWNMAEEKENRINSRTARTLMCALPNELNILDNMHIVDEFAKNISDKYNVGISYSIHNDKNNNNPHMHLMMTTRKIDENQQLKEKVRALDHTNALEDFRANFASIVNKKLSEKNINNISHLSYKNQGLAKLPTIHNGANSEYNQRVTEYNKILAEEKQLLEMIEEMKTKASLDKKNMAAHRAAVYGSLAKNQEDQEFMQDGIEIQQDEDETNNDYAWVNEVGNKQNEYEEEEEDEEEYESPTL